MSENVLFLILFVVFILGVLMLDLLVIGRKSHEVSIREASIWSIVWIMLALGFAVFLRFFGEHVHGIRSNEELTQVFNNYYPYLSLDVDSYARNLEIFRKNITANYLSGYLIEKSLSVDNLFVILAILKAFTVKKEAYKQVLFWGILGAIVMRFIFIFAGAALIIRFEWLLYIFGAYLLYIGVKMYLNRNREFQIEPQNHPMVKFLSKRFNVFPRYVDNKFFIRQERKFFITPLFIVLMLYTRSPRPLGAASGLFIGLYGLFRFYVEFFRLPDPQLGYLYWGWVTMGQLLSLPMILIGFTLVIWAYRHNRVMNP